MLTLSERIRIFASFWVLIAGYFIIPLWIDTIEAPQWFTAWDESIPFLGWMVVPYYLHYFAILLPPFIWKESHRIRLITGIVNGLTLICYGFYIIWPIDCLDLLNSAPENTFSFMHNVVTLDYLHQNAFPSMHMAISGVIGFLIIHDFPKYRIPAGLFVIGIFLSTFLIKQHFILDSISGIALAIMGYAYFRKNVKVCQPEGILKSL